MQWTKDNKEHVLHGLGISYGTTLICLNIAKIKSLGYVSLMTKFSVSYPLVMIVHVGDTLE